MARLPGSPDGPRSIQPKTRQIALPAWQLAHLGLSPGDDVYLQLEGDPPDRLVVWPASRFVAEDEATST